MTSRDVEKRLGIPRKWLDNYAKKRGKGRGIAFDWESHFSEMQNLYKSENHKKYNKSTYLQLNLCRKRETVYGKIRKTQIGIYPLDYADEILQAMKSCLYLRYYFIDKMDYEIKTLESWAKNNEINDYDHVDICNFFLYELANQECLQSNLELVQVNRSPSSLRLKNKLEKEYIKQLPDYMKENGYSSELNYAKKILAIRKYFNIELPDEKIEVGKHIKNLENNDHFSGIIDFESNYFSKTIQEILETLRNIPELKIQDEISENSPEIDSSDINDCSSVTEEDLLLLLEAMMDTTPNDPFQKMSATGSL